MAQTSRSEDGVDEAVAMAWEVSEDDFRGDSVSWELLAAMLARGAWNTVVVANMMAVLLSLR